MPRLRQWWRRVNKAHKTVRYGAVKTAFHCVSDAAGRPEKHQPAPNVSFRQRFQIIRRIFRVRTRPYTCLVMRCRLVVGWSHRSTQPGGVWFHPTFAGEDARKRLAAGGRTSDDRCSIASCGTNSKMARGTRNKTAASMARGTQDKTAARHDRRNYLLLWLAFFCTPRRR